MSREEQIEGFRNREVFAPQGGEVRAYCKKIGNFIILPFTKYLDEKNMGEMGRACSTHGRDEKPIKNIGRPERKRVLR
jgi:hypothetical protein